MKNLFKYWSRNKSALLLTILSIVISLPTIVVANYGVRWISNIIDDPANMWYWTTLLLGGYVYTIVADFICQYIGRINVFMLYNSLLEDYMSKVLTADYGMYTKLSASHIDTVSEQISAIAGSIKQISAIVKNLLTVVTLFVSLYTINKSMLLPVFGIYTLGIIILKYQYQVAARLDSAQSVAKRVRNQEVFDVINGFSEVRAFCKEDYHLSSIKMKNGKIYDASTKKVKSIRLICTIFNIVDISILLVALYFTIYGVTNEMISGSLGITIVVLCTKLISPMINIIDISDDFSATMAMMPQFNEIMNWGNTQDGTIELSTFNSSIEFKNVGFKYDESEKILNNINLTIKKGEKIGICGASGGGKSTMIKLLLKFYSSNEGAILVDGINIADLSAKSLRKHIGLVSQDTYIFNGTIKENVAYGKPYATEQEIIEACRKAGLYDLIQQLPEGFETQVGPRGLKLSGGQKQRIAIARIFLTDPNIVLLDEATSVLDNESEQIVQESLSYLNGKTIISVAHRLTTIQDSDIIVVLDNHSIAEMGSHEELLAMDGIYSKLYRKVK